MLQGIIVSPQTKRMCGVQNIITQVNVFEEEYKKACLYFKSANTLGNFL